MLRSLGKRRVWSCSPRGGRGRRGEGEAGEADTLGVTLQKHILISTWLFCIFVSLKLFLGSTNPSSFVCFSVRVSIMEGRKGSRLTLLFRANAVGFMIRPALIYKHANSQPWRQKVNTGCPSFGCMTRRPGPREALEEQSSGLEEAWGNHTPHTSPEAHSVRKTRQLQQTWTLWGASFQLRNGDEGKEERITVQKRGCGYRGGIQWSLGFQRPQLRVKEGEISAYWQSREHLCSSRGDDTLVVCTISDPSEPCLLVSRFCVIPCLQFGLMCGLL